jgi:hypothetical protein
VGQGRGGLDRGRPRARRGGPTARKQVAPRCPFVSGILSHVAGVQSVALAWLLAA